LLGIGLAWARFASGRVPADAGVLGTILRRAYFVDDLYQGVIVRPVLALGSLLGAGVERGVLDGGSRGLATLTGGTSRALRSLQTGLVRNYALAIVVGAIALLAFFIVHQ
jgi:NADH-quinone oxidoreductase subunit L